jgi:hypothetical protein
MAVTLKFPIIAAAGGKIALLGVATTPSIAIYYSNNPSLEVHCFDTKKNIELFC